MSVGMACYIRPTMNSFYTVTYVYSNMNTDSKEYIHTAFNGENIWQCITISNFISLYNIPSLYCTDKSVISSTVVCKHELGSSLGSFLGVGLRAG